MVMSQPPYISGVYGPQFEEKCGRGAGEPQEKRRSGSGTLPISTKKSRAMFLDLVLLPDFFGHPAGFGDPFFPLTQFARQESHHLRVIGSSIDLFAGVRIEVEKLWGKALDAQQLPRTATHCGGHRPPPVKFSLRGSCLLPREERGDVETVEGRLRTI